MDIGTYPGAGGALPVLVAVLLCIQMSQRNNPFTSSPWRSRKGI